MNDIKRVRVTLEVFNDDTNEPYDVFRATHDCEDSDDPPKYIGMLMANVLKSVIAAWSAGSQPDEFFYYFFGWLGQPWSNKLHKRVQSWWRDKDGTLDNVSFNDWMSNNINIADSKETVK